MVNPAVVFDMDGVVVDTEPIYREMNQEIFKKLDLSVDDKTKFSIMGGTTKRKWTIIKEKFSLSESVDELISIQHKVFSQREWDFNQLLFPEVLPLLKLLKEQDIPTALATSSDKERVNAVLEQCNLREYFNEIICGVDFERGKPDPEIFLHTAKKLGVSPQNCIVIEDSYNGLSAAKNANMYAIGVRHKLINMDLSLADKIIHSLDEVNVENLKEIVLGKEIDYRF